ncbi:hypothetical protein, partial [Vibrio parahaemolyticus]|uniref:hypothetical protein n=1 Tax=Vibrio parahaemolyticus TaxID=670 RepID=UPI001C4EAAD4
RIESFSNLKPVKVGQLSAFFFKPTSVFQSGQSFVAARLTSVFKAFHIMLLFNILERTNRSSACTNKLLKSDS